MSKYDYLVVGAGLAGVTSAYIATHILKKSCLVIEKKNEIGGYCATRNMNGINVHMYGAHIFRTDDKRLWDFVNSITPFKPFVNTPIAKYHGEAYNLPFNMNTFNKLFGATTPEEAKKEIERTRVPNRCPRNLEEYVLDKVGSVVYEKLIKEYTEKQWGCKCSELPISTMKRIPIRFEFNNSYYNERYQGVPEKGYTHMFEKMLEGSDVELGVDYLKVKEEYDNIADNVVYTGPIDEYFGSCYGDLEWRSVTFKHKYISGTDNYQGVAVVNYTDDTPYTRTIEHKHFMNTTSRGTIVTQEFPCDAAGISGNKCYPILNDENKAKYEKYKALACKEERVMFFGRLATYNYCSMDEILDKIVKTEKI